MLFLKQKEDQREENVVGKVISVPVSSIEPNPAQPRVFFDDYALTRLAVSIQQNGIMQPLIVRKTERGYQLIAGERRLRAAKLVNLEYVPCIVSEKEDKESAVMAILENIQRADLNYLEEAVAIKRLIEHYEITQEEAAQKLGIAQSTVANKLRLLQLNDSEKEAVLKYGLNERQARAILKIPEGRREAAARDIYINRLNTVQADRYVEELLRKIDDEKKPKPKIISRTDPINTISLYLNSFKKTVEQMKTAGIPCDFSKTKTEDFVECVVKIPLK
ncbi:MAG TPA: hypothetical protein DDX91_09010 [Ruminococcaceae bacterium]|nr:hypothetical protein [Oscillospiraceae bacterium]